MRKFIVSLIAVAFVFLLCACSSASPASSSTTTASSSSAVSTSHSASSDRMSTTANTVFGYGEQYEVKSGSGEPTGTVSVFSAKSSDCTLENIELWCNQYVRAGVDNWCVVQYSDKLGHGIYASGSIVEVGVDLASDYSIADDSSAEFYVFSADDITQNGKLVPME